MTVRSALRTPFATVLASRRCDAGSRAGADMAVNDDLERFLVAQSGVYEGVLGELRSGRKTGHWIWYIFPQLIGLGRSETSRFYAITSLVEARAYLAHPVLGGRLRECGECVLAIPERSAVEIFGSLDAAKVRSCMTLFQRAAPHDPIFGRVLDRYFDGVPDPLTEALLASGS